MSTITDGKNCNLLSMSSKEAVPKQLLKYRAVKDLKIASPAAHSTDVFCKKVEGELTFHRVSLIKHGMRRRVCRVHCTFFFVQLVCCHTDSIKCRTGQRKWIKQYLLQSVSILSSFDHPHSFLIYCHCFLACVRCSWRFCWRVRSLQVVIYRFRYLQVSLYFNTSSCNRRP